MSAWSDLGLEQWQSEGPKWAFTTPDLYVTVMSPRTIPEAVEWLEAHPKAEGRKVCRHCMGTGEAPNPAFSCGQARCDGGWAR